MFQIKNRNAIGVFFDCRVDFAFFLGWRFFGVGGVNHVATFLVNGHNLRKIFLEIVLTTSIQRPFLPSETMSSKARSPASKSIELRTPG